MFHLLVRRLTVFRAVQIRVPESFEDDRERQLIADTCEARYYVLNNPPTMEEILEQVRQSGFVPTLAGKPIESVGKPVKKRSKKSALSKHDSIGVIKRAALRFFAAQRWRRAVCGRSWFHVRPRGSKRYAAWTTANLAKGNIKTKSWSLVLALNKNGRWLVHIRALDGRKNASAARVITITRR